MTFGPHRKSEETYLAYTRADDSFRQLGRHVWCLPALAINDRLFKNKNIGKSACHESNGASVVDCLFIIDYNIWNILTNFEVHGISDLSNHCATEFSIDA